MAKRNPLALTEAQLSWVLDGACWLAEKDREAAKLAKWRQVVIPIGIGIIAIAATPLSRC